MTPIDLQAEAARILDAHARRVTLAPISGSVVLTLDQAYAIQALVTQARLDRGERVVGWKLGYTSLAMREQMGIDAPNFGPLTDAMLLPDGGQVPDTLTQPRVEPEVALRLAWDIPAGADRDGVLACVASAHASLEIVDSVWTDYRFRLPDNTADGSSAAAVVLGPTLALAQLQSVEVTLWADGIAVGQGRGSDASGHPAEGVVWLAARLAERGQRLRAGDVIITGGLTRAEPLHPGACLRASFTPGGAEVTVRRAAQGAERASGEP